MTSFEIETLAMEGRNMPRELGTAEQLLFQKLRCLYATHRVGGITFEQGKREKAKIMEQFKADSLAERIHQQHLRIYNQAGSLLADANKSDCERCKLFARLLDGRQTSIDGREP